MTRIQRKYNEGGFGAALAEYDHQLSWSWALGSVISYVIARIMLEVMPQFQKETGIAECVAAAVGYVLLWLLCVAILRWRTLKDLQELHLRSWFQSQIPTCSSIFSITDELPCEL